MLNILLKLFLKFKILMVLLLVVFPIIFNLLKLVPPSAKNPLFYSNDTAKTLHLFNSIFLNNFDSLLLYILIILSALLVRKKSFSKLFNKYISFRFFSA